MATPRRRLAISSNPHDFIQVSIFVIDDIFAQSAPLYEQGLSLREIADRTGFPKTKIPTELIKGGVALRPTRVSTRAGLWRARGKAHVRPPYGFCFLEGRFTKEPREYPVLLLIHRLWKSGENANSIAVTLNGKRHRSRMGREWSWNSVRNIIERFEKGQIVVEGGKCELR
jgi:hypothetical protein